MIIFYKWVTGESRAPGEGLPPGAAVRGKE